MLKVEEFVDDNVSKFVFTGEDIVVESVLYRYPTYEDRTVICCSTQSGCPMGCRFCGAGDYFVRNLTSEEILYQIEYCLEKTGLVPAEIKNLQIMFMSMGEPMLNLRALIPALYELYYKYPHAKLLVSTSGPDIGEDGWEDFHNVAYDIPTIGLQFSVHESTDEARNLLVPFKKKMTLEQMYFEGYLFSLTTDRKPFFNYCAHEGNNSDEDADRLLDLYNPIVFNATVSVICEQNEGLPATSDYQRKLAVDFGEKLLARGFDVRVFDPAGQDTIGGGCGQLWFVQKWMQEHPELARPSVGNRLGKIHTPVLGVS